MLTWLCGVSLLPDPSSVTERLLHFVVVVGAYSVCCEVTVRLTGHQNPITK